MNEEKEHERIISVIKNFMVVFGLVGFILSFLWVLDAIQ